MDEFLCWIEDEQEEEDARKITAVDPEWAAVEACDYWESRSRFENLDDINVLVRNHALGLVRVTVERRLEVEFYAAEAKPVEPRGGA